MSQTPIPPSNTIPTSTTMVANEESELVQDFQKLFEPGKSYTSLALLRSTIADYGQRHNIVMSTKNSNYRSVHLWCKHAGVYRKGKKRVNTEKPSNETENKSTKVIKSRKKETQRTDCRCYIKAKLIGELWVVEHSYGGHNHAIPKNKTVYSLHRRQSEEIKNLILQLLNNGQKISSILEYLHMIGINNIIKKDIENLQQQFRRNKKLNIKPEDHENISTIVASFPIIIPTAPSPALIQTSNQYTPIFDQPQQPQQENTHMLYPSTTSITTTTTTTTAAAATDLIPDIISSYTNHTPSATDTIKEHILLNTSTTPTVEDIVESIEIAQHK